MVTSLINSICPGTERPPTRSPPARSAGSLRVRSTRPRSGAEHGVRLCLLRFGGPDASPNRKEVGRIDCLTIRVAHVLDDLAASSGGTVRACVDLCEALARETSCRPVIFTQCREAREVPVEKEVDVHRLRVKGGLLKLRRSREFFEQDFESSGIQLIHINGLWSPFLHAAVEVSNRLRTPLIISPHGMLEPWSLNQKRFKKWLALRLYQRADLNSANLIHATASSEAFNLHNLGLEHTFTLPNGVHERAVAKRLPSDDQKRALFLSRIHPKKGIENLLRAWAAVRPDRWSLKIVGPGEPRYVDRLRDLRDELRLNGTVHFEPPGRRPGEVGLTTRVPTYSYYRHSAKISASLLPRRCNQVSP